METEHKEIKKGYKVFFRHPELGLISASSMGCSLRYEDKGQWIVPDLSMRTYPMQKVGDIGPFAVFMDIEHAEHFIRNQLHSFQLSKLYEIYEIEYVACEVKQLWFMDSENEHYFELNDWNFPGGTDVAERFRFLRRVG